MVTPVKIVKNIVMSTIYTLQELEELFSFLTIAMLTNLSHYYFQYILQ